MNFWHILFGVALIALGAWFTVRQIIAFANDVPDSLGGNISLLIGGFGMVVIGIMVIVQNI